MPEHLASPETDASGAELAPSVKWMLACLPGKYRQALMLAEYEGLKQHEIAERLGISLSGAELRVQRRRKKLRDILLDCCHCDVYVIPQRGEIRCSSARPGNCTYPGDTGLISNSKRDPGASRLAIICD